METRKGRDKKMSETVDSKISQFCDYLQMVSGLPVLKARAGATPQLNKTFASVNLIDCTPVYKDTSTYVDLDPNDLMAPRTQVVRGLVVMNFVVSVFGKGALQACHKIAASFRTDIFDLFSETKSFGLMNAPEVSNIAAQILDSKFEDRGEVRCQFYVPIPVDFASDHFISDQITVEEPEKNFKETFTISSKGINK